MTAASSALGPRPQLGWRGWTGLLLFDLILVATLPKADFLAVGLIGLFVLGYVTRRPPVAAALALFGIPLLWPLVLLGTSADTLFVPNVLLLLPLVLLGWSAAWEFPDLGDASDRLSRLFRDPVFLTTIALGVWMAARCLGTPSPMYGRGKTVQFFITTVPILAFAIVFFGGGERIRTRSFQRFVRATLVFVLIISLFGIWNISSQYWPSGGRLRVLGVNPIWVARLTGTTMLLVIASWGARRMSPLLALPLLVVFFLPFYAAGSRGPLLALLLSLVFWWMLGGRVRMRALVASVLAVATGLLVVAIEFGWVLEDSPLAGHDASNLSRAFYLKTVFDLGSSPGLFGIGTGGFSAAARFGDMRLYPHNIFLELWTELGAVGVGLLLAWLTLLAVRGRKAWALAGEVHAGVPGKGLFPTERERLRLLAAMLLFALVNAQLSGDLSVNTGLWFWGGVLAAASTVGASVPPVGEGEDGDREGGGAREGSEDPADPVGAPLRDP